MLNVTGVTVYPKTASGDQAPTATIAGPDTGIVGPSGIALDADGNIYIANKGNNSITVYPPGSNGDQVPSATIIGAKTGLGGVEGVAVDSEGTIYALNFNGVTVYPDDANSNPEAKKVTKLITVYEKGANGNQAPKVIIGGSGSDFADPAGIALDAAGNIYVANIGPPSAVNIYPKGSAGDQVPSATIVGGSTGLNGDTNDVLPFGITVDFAGNIYVANNGTTPGTVTEYPAGSSGGQPPIRTLIGGSGGIDIPSDVAVDLEGNIYVANERGDNIVIYAPGATSPTAQISGPDTGLDSPLGIAIGPP